MKHTYGEFTSEQIADQKKSLHSALFWLLLYKDPDTSYKYEYVDVDKYFKSLMLRIGGLNSLLNYPAVLVTLMSVLQAAKDENLKEDFDYPTYRKLVLDAHTLVDQLPEIE